MRLSSNSCTPARAGSLIWVIARSLPALSGRAATAAVTGGGLHPLAHDGGRRGLRLVVLGDGTGLGVPLRVARQVLALGGGRGALGQHPAPERLQRCLALLEV